MPQKTIDDKGQAVIAAALRYGSIISTVVMALGVALAFIMGGAKTSPQPPSLGNLIIKALDFDPLGVTQLGILLLLLTPVFRIFVAVVTFGLERDLRYFLISSGVFLIVLGSIAYGVR